MTITMLLGTDGSLSEQMDAIRLAVTDLVSTLTTITTNIDHASHSSHKAAIDTTAAERSIEEAERALSAAERNLEYEGQNALREAKEAQMNLGIQSDRMTRIALEARTEAER